MKLAVLALLLVPLAAMIAGFLIAARAVVRGGDSRQAAYTPSGRPILRSEARASLRSLSGAAALPGPGSLLLTDREILLERFFPRREFRIELDRLISVQSEPARRTNRGTIRLAWQRNAETPGDGLSVEVPDAPAWEEAIRRACASARGASGASPTAHDPAGGS